MEDTCPIDWSQMATGNNEQVRCTETTRTSFFFKNHSSFTILCEVMWSFNRICWRQQLANSPRKKNVILVFSAAFGPICHKPSKKVRWIDIPSKIGSSENYAFNTGSQATGLEEFWVQNTHVFIHFGCANSIWSRLTVFLSREVCIKETIISW